MAQLEALGRFLEEKKQDILEATALDMGKVREAGCRALWLPRWGPTNPFLWVLYPPGCRCGALAIRVPSIGSCIPRGVLWAGMGHP